MAIFTWRENCKHEVLTTREPRDTHRMIIQDRSSQLAPRRCRGCYSSSVSERLLRIRILFHKSYSRGRRGSLACTTCGSFSRRRQRSSGRAWCVKAGRRGSIWGLVRTSRCLREVRRADCARSAPCFGHAAGASGCPARRRSLEGRSRGTCSRGLGTFL